MFCRTRWEAMARKGGKAMFTDEGEMGA